MNRKSLILCLTLSFLSISTSYAAAAWQCPSASQIQYSDAKGYYLTVDHPTGTTVFIDTNATLPKGTLPKSFQQAYIYGKGDSAKDGSLTCWYNAGVYSNGFYVYLKPSTEKFMPAPKPAGQYWRPQSRGPIADTCYTGSSSTVGCGVVLQ